MTTLDPDTIVVDMQAQIKARIASDPWFNGIDIWTPEDVDESGKPQAVADIAQRIGQSLSALSKGTCIVVTVPALLGFSPDAPGLYADSVTAMVRVVENPLVNRGKNGTQKTVSMVGIRVTRLLWHFVYLGNALVPQRSGLIPSDPKEGNLVWDLVLKTRIDLPALELSTPES